MTALSNEELINVSGGTENVSTSKKHFKCLTPGCTGTVTGESIDDMNYEGRCPLCGNLWDYSVYEAIG